ncbi:MAG TPA: cell envelope integrity protein CreD [Puia sp.]|jgi:inner membrane protein|nr:cell envelope integrity protein CreD [Puia sp.]
MPGTTLSARIWFLSSLILDAGVLIFYLIQYPQVWYIFLPAFLVIIAGSFPVFIILAILLPIVKRLFDSFNNKIYLTILVCGVCAFIYGSFGYLLAAIKLNTSDYWTTDGLEILLAITGILFCISLIALYLSKNQIAKYFEYSKTLSLTNKNRYMETSNYAESNPIENKTSRSNKILIKGAITAALIGIMMIPTVFISDLVHERQARNESVVKEVDSRWAMAQTLTGPYIYLPYNKIIMDAANKPQLVTSHLLMLPDNKQVDGKIDHELRERSIYKVLLYRASISDQGNFILQLPKDVISDQVQWADAKICFGISDFKGIEERLVIRFKGNDNELSPGLPSDDTDEKGLSAPITISNSDMGKPLNYQIHLKIKGSEMLHFVPLSGNSHYTLESTWPSPSFDGNNLPSERTVSEKGFTAAWNFNKANLPFGTVLNDFKFDRSALAFGVTMIQPADQYAKTNRSIKYAILIIGLTFSLFFIIELMQRKPIHPVQYVLIGLGLVIFYSLLLAISEFLDFDYAYLIASVGTILLIGLYAKSHFKSWKSSGIFSGVLTLLYGFIFVLIRLEDTALLVGSIGLFIILALTMYASKKVNWYGQTEAVVL